MTHVHKFVVIEQVGCTQRQVSSDKRLRVRVVAKLTNVPATRSTKDKIVVNQLWLYTICTNETLRPDRYR